MDEPVAVLDYSSLYPSSMISENISHDSVVGIWDCDLDGEMIDESFKGNREACFREGLDFVDVTFDRMEADPEDTRKNPVKNKVGTRTCRFVQFEDGKKGTIPDILKKLLAARKATKKEMKKESDPFRKKLLDSLQLAYKVTANSL